MLYNSESTRKELVEVSQDLSARGWVANHDGNATARMPQGRFLATPGATSKARVNEKNLITIDDKRHVVSGSGKSFSEIGLHLTVYQAREDVFAVVHAHPPYATALAVSGQTVLERPFMAEAVVSLGASVPTVPFAMPGDAAERALAPYVLDYDAVLLAQHGVLTWGASVEQAFLRLELVEHLAKIATLAGPGGGVRYLSTEQVAPLLAARAKAGLGRAADNAGKAVVACGITPTSNVQVLSPVSASRTPDVRGVVREEILRALTGSR